MPRHGTTAAPMASSSLSGYNAWKKRPVSQHQRQDQQLAEQIQAVYHSCRQVFGAPRSRFPAERNHLTLCGCNSSVGIHIFSDHLDGNMRTHPRGL